jgi:hypothetical protein
VRSSFVLELPFLETRFDMTGQHRKRMGGGGDCSRHDGLQNAKHARAGKIGRHLDQRAKLLDMGVQASATKRMFYADEGVASLQFGHGLVLLSGFDPVVRFFSGAQLRVVGISLRPVPDDRYDAGLQNWIAAEQFTHRCAYGEPLDEAMFAPYRRRTKPLIERIEEAERRPPVAALLTPVHGTSHDGQHEALPSPCGARTYPFP